MQFRNESNTHNESAQNEPGTSNRNNAFAIHGKYGTGPAIPWVLAVGHDVDVSSSGVLRSNWYEKAKRMLHFNIP
jgi:hypothetical protein